MRLSEALSHLPDDTRCSVVLGGGDLTLGELRSALAAQGSNRDMTARELAAEFGHSKDWWQDRARAGEIPGSYQAGERGRWYIPRESATVFLRETRERGSRKRRHRRPWKGPGQEAA